MTAVWGLNRLYNVLDCVMKCIFSIVQNLHVCLAHDQATCLCFQPFKKWIFIPRQRWRDIGLALSVHLSVHLPYMPAIHFEVVNCTDDYSKVRVRLTD